MEQFSLDKYLENPSRKVVTRDGRPVRILCTDRKAKSGNIVGLVGPDESVIYVWVNNGKHIVSEIPDNDLFFADEEEELTEFENKLADFLIYSHPIDTKSTKRMVKRISKQFLDLARKDLEKDNVIFDKDKYLEICDQYYNNGKKNALKDLPKWEKSNHSVDLDEYVCVIDFDGTVVTTDVLEKGDYFIKLNELLKLPKEE